MNNKIPKFKICPRCGKKKGVDKFGKRKRKSGKVNLQSHCIECRSKPAKGVSKSKKARGSK